MAIGAGKYRLALTLSEREWEIVEFEAAKQHRSKSELVEHIILAHFEREGRLLTIPARQKRAEALYAHRAVRKAGPDADGK